MIQTVLLSEESVIEQGYKQGSSIMGRKERKSVWKSCERTVLETNIEEVK
jgi:hypothetical protein